VGMMYDTMASFQVRGDKAVVKKRFAMVLLTSSFFFSL
jgi:hypothetical protein